VRLPPCRQAKKSEISERSNMNNRKIIEEAAVTAGIFTEEQIEAYQKEGDLPLKTYIQWKNLGYTVRKGEEAKVTTYVWQYSQKLNRYIKVKSKFFTKSQVTEGKKR
jgi:hypothetical protein